MARDSVKIHIDGDDSGFQKSLSGIEKVAKKGFSAVVKGATAASAGIAALAGVAINNFKEYEQLVGGVDTLFKESSQKVQQNAAKAYKTAGMSANEYMQTAMGFSASLKQSFDNTAEGISKAADVADMAVIDMSDNANKMGTSMELIQNAYQGFAKQNYTMLDNLKLGYGGTKTEMERLLADAQKLSGVKYDINNLADVYNAIHVIQTELGITGTTALEASETIEGSVNMMKASWQNLMTGIADENADFEKLLDEFIDSVMTVGDNILPVLEKTIKGIGDFVSEAASELLPKAADVLIDTLPSLISSVGKLAGGLGEALIECFEQVTDNADEIVDAAIEIGEAFIEGLLDFIPKIIDAAGEMIAALADALGDSIPILKPVTELVKLFGGNLEHIAKVAIPAIIAVKAFNTVMSVAKSMSAFSSSGLGKFVSGLGSVTSASGTAASAVGGATVAGTGAAGGGLAGAFGAVGTAVTGALATFAPYLVVAGALVGGTALLVNATRIYTEEELRRAAVLEECAEKNDRIIQGCNEARVAYEENIAAITENTNAQLTEISKTELLVNELSRLTDANGKVTDANRTRVEYILGELNSALGTEYQLVENQVQGYQQLTSSIQQSIDAKKSQPMLEDMEQKYTAALEKRASMEELANQASENANTLMEEKARLVKEYIDEQTYKLGELEAGTITVAEAEEQLLKSGSAMGDSFRDIVIELDQAQTAAEEYGAAISECDEIAALYTDVSEKINAGDYTGAVAAYEAYFGGLEETAKTTSANVEDTIIEMGEKLNNLELLRNSATTEEAKAGWQTLIDDLKAKAATLEEDLKQEGYNGVQGIIDGLSDPGKKAQVRAAAYALGVIAVQGYKAGQDSNSPSKEFMKAAGDGVRGIVIGFEKGEKDVYKASYSLAETGVEAYNEGQDAHSPAKEYIEASKNSIDGLVEGVEKYKDDFIESIGAMAKEGVAEGAKVARKSLSELEELFLHGEDISGYNITEAQQAYLDEALRQEQAKEKTAEEIQREADEWKLKKLRMTAEEEIKILEEKEKERQNLEKERLAREKEAAKERQKILEAEMDGYISFFEERTDAAIDAMKELAEAQEKFQSKLYDEVELFRVDETTFVGLGEDGQDLVIKKPELNDLGAQRKELEDYVGLLDAVKERGGVPEELFSEMRDMSVEEGTNFANALLKASDEDFASYIENWKYLKDTTEGLSKDVYEDEARELYDAFEKEFGQIPEDFFKFGEDAASRFGDGFMEKVGGLLEGAYEEIMSSMNVLLPSLVNHSMGGVKETLDPNIWNTTYIINTSGNESTHQLLQATRQNDAVERMRKR